MLRRHRLYNAALRAVSRDRVSYGVRRTDRALRLLQRMRRERVPPSNFSVQQLFAASRGEVGVDDLVQMLMNEMNLGIRPSRPTLDAMFGAAPIATNASEARLPLFLQVLDTCQHNPSGRTVIGLMRQVVSHEDVETIGTVLSQLPGPTRDALLRDGCFHTARARVDASDAATGLLAEVRAGGGPLSPSPRAWRAVVLGCAAAKDHGSCLSLLQVLWSRGSAIDGRAARRLLHLAGEGAAAREPGAVELLLALRTAMFDEQGGAAGAQRGASRRSAKAEHEAARILARAEWRAGLGDAERVQRVALERLQRAAVPPQRKLVTTCVYLHSKQGDFGAALALLDNPPCSREQMQNEGPYLALLAAVSQPADVEHAVSALRRMVGGGVIPSLRTRIAFARMAARVRQEQAMQVATTRRRAVHVPRTVPLPSATAFWRPSAQQQLPLEPLLEALKGEDGVAVGGGSGPGHASAAEGDDIEHARHHERVSVAAELVLEVQLGALLERIEVLMRAAPASLVEAPSEDDD